MHGANEGAKILDITAIKDFKSKPGGVLSPPAERPLPSTSPPKVLVRVQKRGNSHFPRVGMQMGHLHANWHGGCSPG